MSDYYIVFNEFEPSYHNQVNVFTDIDKAIDFYKECCNSLNFYIMSIYKDDIKKGMRYLSQTDKAIWIQKGKSNE